MEHFLASETGGGRDRKVGQLIGAFTDKTGRIEDHGEGEGFSDTESWSGVVGQKADGQVVPPPPLVSYPSEARYSTFRPGRRQPTAK